MFLCPFSKCPPGLLLRAGRGNKDLSLRVLHYKWRDFFPTMGFEAKRLGDAVWDSGLGCLGKVRSARLLVGEMTVLY